MRGYVATGYSDASFYATDVWEYSSADVGITEPVQAGMTAVYNAYANQVIISSGEKGLLHFDLYDLTGKKCFSAESELQGAGWKQALPTLPGGIYIAALEQGGKRISKKILISKR
ncbi:MAG: hypothetical protein FD123_2945 [Bacteroidetes bacterium]|nr:MAG: hypothetical protein FD123_2945 [Bacteroidota bacterium]